MKRGTHPNSLANLNRFTSTNQPAQGGRKPSKLKKFMKDNNVSNEDVGRMIRSVLFDYTMDQLSALEHDDKKPMIIRLFARAFRADWQRGSLQNFQTFVDRAYGAPSVNVNVSGGLEIANAPPQARRARIDELLEALDFKGRADRESADSAESTEPDQQTSSPDLQDPTLPVPQ